MNLGILTSVVPDSQSLWTYTVDELGRYFENRVTAGAEPEIKKDGASLVALAQSDMPRAVSEHIGSYLQLAETLGVRTAQLHLSLAADPTIANLLRNHSPRFYQRSVYQSMRNLSLQTLEMVEARKNELSPQTQEIAERVLAAKDRILECFKSIFRIRIDALRIRCHGDLHLGHVLYTGKDFFFTDFEGEPVRPLTERKIKRSPMRDVAGMIRSFDYAAESALRKQLKLGSINQEQMEALRPWRRLWRNAVSASFLKSYFQTIGTSALLPKSDEARTVLLETCLLEKAIYELAYEMNHRPAWVEIPMRGILNILDAWEKE